MRIDARHGHFGWRVYHAARCEVLRGVVWVDDDSRQWFQYDWPLRVVGGEVSGVVYDAERIVIHQSSRLVVINPVPDECDLDVVAGVAASRPMVVA